MDENDVQFSTTLEYSRPVTTLEITHSSYFDANKVQAEIKKICQSISELLIEKNRKYGNSALEPRRIFSKASPLEQINVRIDDKLSRIMNRQSDEDEDVEKDLCGYLILKMVYKNIKKKEKQDRDKELSGNAIKNA